MSKKRSSTFIEICIYEVKPEKVDEFEELIKKVFKHHSNFPGVVDVRYMKRTHRPGSFGDAKKGNPLIKLTKTPKSYIYALYWELDNEIIHGKATKSGLENYFREFRPADLPAEVSTQAGPSQFCSDIFKQTPQKIFVTEQLRVLRSYYKYEIQSYRF